MITVTKPFLPDKEVFQKYIDQIWSRNWLTNNGPIVNELELSLKKLLGLKHLLFTSNGTIALQLAMKALQLKNEIITTPFSYVATTSSIVWEQYTPVFADIEPNRLTIDPYKIEALITEKTSAIVATHVFGLPCFVEEIEKIAKTNNLKVIYDGAHAFGTQYNGKSLLSYGDISTLSTHATKLYHTVEGGFVITENADLLKTLAYLRNFGHDGPYQFKHAGINGKNSEFHAAMGLANLQHSEEIMNTRKRQWLLYNELLSKFKGKSLQIPEETEYNYAYYPILFETEQELITANELLERNKIYCRRYFYPSLNTLEYITQKGQTPIADNISKRILCLPLFHTLTKEDQILVCRLILRAQNYG